MTKINNATDMENYAWFIYILTFLLTFAIIFIAFLIVLKCIQTCTEMRILCCKKLRRRRRANVHNPTERSLSESCSASFNSSSSSFSDDFSDNNRVNGDHSSIIIERGHENSCFDQIYDESQQIQSSKKLKKKSVINRKYDDTRRYEKTNHNDLLKIKSISNKDIDFQSYNLDDLFNRISTYDISHFKTGQLPINSAIIDLSNLNYEINNGHLNNEESEDAVSFSSRKLCNNNLNDRLSPKLDMENEIPPSYDQIVNKESTV